MTKKNNNKIVYGLRLDGKLIEDYKLACDDLPFFPKPPQLIELFMDFIIKSSQVFNESGGKLKLTISNNQTSITLFDNTQLFIEVSND